MRWWEVNVADVARVVFVGSVVGGGFGVRAGVLEGNGE